MKQTLTVAFVACAGLVIGLSPAGAQAPSGAYLGAVRCNGVIVQHKGRLACARGGASYAPNAGHAYERWGDSGPALSGSSSGNGFPAYFRGFGSVHDLGR